MPKQHPRQAISMIACRTLFVPETGSACEFALDDPTHTPRAQLTDLSGASGSAAARYQSFLRDPAGLIGRQKPTPTHLRVLGHQKEFS
jgi:hypothetical protein